MTPFFSSDITYDKNSEIFVSEAFVTARAEAHNAKAYEEYCESGIELLETAKAPFILRFLRTACGILGIGLLCGFFEALIGEDAVSLGEMPPIGWLFPIAGAVLIGAFFLSRRPL